MSIRYGLTRQPVGTRLEANAIPSAWMMIVAALCLAPETAAAMTFPGLVAQDAASIAASPNPSYGLTNAPSFELALLGGEPTEEIAMFDAVGDARNDAASASADSLADFAGEGDAYSVMSSARGFESSGGGRAWGASLLAAAGVTAVVLNKESSRHATHDSGFGAGGSHSPGTPSSTPSIGSDDPPADVPEPGTLALLAAGTAISAAFRRRRA